jgi:signal peptidase I
MLPWHWHIRRVRMGAALCWLLGGFCFALLIASIVPMALGMHTYTVRSGSMTPAIRTGDIIVDEPIPPAEAKVGDIVTFKDPEDSGRLITHRARAISTHGSRIDFVTRGDANNTFEHWSVPADGRIGRVLYRVPAIGYPLTWIGSGPGRIGLIVIPAAILLALGLLRIWAPGRVGGRDPVPRTTV